MMNVITLGCPHTSYLTHYKKLSECVLQKTVVYTLTVFQMAPYSLPRGVFRLTLCTCVTRFVCVAPL
jgi:hypothetical protein